MKEIPLFSLNESEGIAAMLNEAGIKNERQFVTSSVSRYGGNSAVAFHVSDSDFIPAVQAIKSFYGFMDAPAEAVSGTCPACNTPVEGVFECPECGLGFSFDPRDAMTSHPFVVFLQDLEKQGVLNRWSNSSVC